MLDQNPTKLFHTDVVLNLLLSFRDVQVSVCYRSRGTGECVIAVGVQVSVCYRSRGTGECVIAVGVQVSVCYRSRGTGECVLSQ